MIKTATTGSQHKIEHNNAKTYYTLNTLKGKLKEGGRGRFEPKKNEKKRKSSGSFLIGLTTLRPRTLGQNVRKLMAELFNLLWEKRRETGNIRLKKEEGATLLCIFAKDYPSWLTRHFFPFSCLLFSPFFFDLVVIYRTSCKKKKKYEACMITFLFFLLAKKVWNLMQKSILYLFFWISFCSVVCFEMMEHTILFLF